MPSTNDLMVASLPYKRALREAYIDLRGYDAVWSKIPNNVNRRDFYGDIKQTGFTPELVPIKIVMDTKELYILQDDFSPNPEIPAGPGGVPPAVPANPHTENNINFSLKHYLGIIKFGFDVKKGDIINIEFTKGSNIAAADIRPFRVVDVESKAYKEPICKKIILSPYQ